MLTKKLVVGPYASNCYILGSELTKEGMIIDPGAEAETILGSVKELGLEIKIIVVTHGHIDHVSAVKEVMEATGAEIAISGQNSKVDPVQTVKLRLLKDGDTIDVGDLHLLVLHTPGHSLDGICLLGHGVVFTGDTLFNFGIGRYDLSGGDYDQLMNNIHTKLMVLPDDTLAYPGHGPETTIGTERQSNPFLRGH